MKTFSLFCVLLFTLFSDYCKGQEFLWNPTFTLKKSFAQYYLGGNDSSEFLLTNSCEVKKDELDMYTKCFKTLPLGNHGSFITPEPKLVELDKQFQLKKEYPILFKAPMQLIVDFFFTDELVIIYQSFQSKTLGIYAEFFDMKGVSKRIIKLFDSDEDFSHFISKNNKYVCFYQNGILKFYNNKMELVNESKYSNNFLDIAFTKDKDQFYVLGSDSTNIYLTRVGKDQKSLKINIDQELSSNQFKISIPDDAGKIYVSSIVGILKEKKGGFWSGPGTGDEFKTTGVQLNVIDINKFEETSHKVLSLKNEIIETAKEESLGEKDGLVFMNNKGTVLFMNEPVIQLEKSWMVAKTYSGSSNVLCYPEYGSLILAMPLKADKNQIVIKKAVVKELKYNCELSYYLKPCKNTMHLMFQSSGNSWAGVELNSLILDKDLNIIKQDHQNTYKEKGIYLGIHYGYELNSNNVLFLGRYQKTNGTLIVNYNE